MRLTAVAACRRSNYPALHESEGPCLASDSQALGLTPTRSVFLQRLTRGRFVAGKDLGPQL